MRVFLAVADELHFGRAADRLGITQSRVSQCLRDLERKLGERLVHRTSRRVGLTANGERFRAEAGAAYDGLVGVLERTYEARHQLAGTLRVAMFSPLSGGRHLTTIVDAFEAVHPDCHVRVSTVPWPSTTAAQIVSEQLLQGEAQLLTWWLPVEHPELAIGPVLAREPRVLAAAREHPLAARREVSIEEVADYRVARIDAMSQALLPLKTPSGRPIRRLSRIPVDRDELALLVARGRIVHPTVASASGYWGHPNIVYVPIVDMPPAQAALLWQRGESDRKVHEFVRIAREVLAQAASRSDGRRP